MRHQKPYRKLSRQRSHYRALMRNLAFSLFQHERIETTEAKAKEARRFIDKIITLAKDGTLHARRRAFSLMGNKMASDTEGKKIDVIGKVFSVLAKRMADRKGGYTRIIHLGARPGDAAPKVILELIGAEKPKAAPAPAKTKKGEVKEKDAAAAA
jgi:large subunit ribosomal protein L17